MLSARSITAAVGSGRIMRTGRGHYVLPSVLPAERAARRLSGVLSHTSAALHHGWPVKTPPEHPHVTVPRHRKVDPGRRRRVRLHFADLGAGDCDGPATSPLRTVLDCARALPFDEALAVADSALRCRAVTLPGIGRPDLYDAEARLVVECDSFEFHSSRAAIVRDVERYNACTQASLWLLRFAWDHAMHRHDYVRAQFDAFIRHEGLAVRRLRPSDRASAGAAQQ